MAFLLKKVHVQTILPLILGIWLDLVYVTVADASATTAVAPFGVKKCYKCEDDCNGGPGTVEECHPTDSDSLIFACYTIIVEGKAFQRGCTLDFSEGEDCVKEKGNTYCFCRTDECNNSLGSSFLKTCSKTTYLFSIMAGVFSGKIIMVF